MRYEIINPSDHYTMEAPDLEIAAVVAAFLGNGQYPLRPEEEGAEEVPLFMFGGAEEWFQEKFKRSIDDTLAHVTDTRTAELVDALDSVLIGNREAFFSLVSRDDADFSQKRAKWHDKNRSSMNDIGKRAYQLADHFRKKAQA